MKDNLKILVVNDDGIHAPGIAKLAEAASAFGRVWVVAPDGQCSAMSQKLTIFDRLEVKKQSFPARVEAAYSVSGTPADCVKVALTYLMKEPPDIVFSGMNNGYNTGFDICYSGTVGAAMEALLHGIPAIAFSAQSEKNCEVAEQYLPQVIRDLLDRTLSFGEMWNVNFPCCPIAELKGVLHDRKPAQIALYSNYYEEFARDGEKTILSTKTCVSTAEQAPVGTDIHAVLTNYISIGKLCGVIF